MLQECPKCDSGKVPYVLYDAMGISCGYVCDDCEEKTKGKYNPDVFEQDTTSYRQRAMECGESMEPDE